MAVYLFYLNRCENSVFVAFSFPSTFFRDSAIGNVNIYRCATQFVHCGINDLFNVELIMRATVVFPASFLAVISCQRINRASTPYIYVSTCRRICNVSRPNDKCIEHLTPQTISNVKYLFCISGTIPLPRYLGIDPAKRGSFNVRENFTRVPVSAGKKSGRFLIT